MKILTVGFAVVLGWWIMGQTALHAETRYVTDSFQITLRSGPSIQNKIMRMLRSGQAVEVLESRDEWSRVRLLDGDSESEGWVLSRYLLTRRPWEDQARALRIENEQLKARLSQAERQLKETNGQASLTESTLNEKTKTLNELEKKYEALKRGAADYLKLKKEYDEAKKILTTSQKSVETLTREKEILEASRRNRWFGMGALVLLCGLLIGLTMGRHQKKHKSSILYD